jgi:hypothetical protein
MRRLSSVLLASIALLTAPAFADTLAPGYAQYYYQIQTTTANYGGQLTAAQQLGYYHNPSPVGSVGAVINGGTDPAIGSFVGASGAAVPYGETATASAYYEFQVLGAPNQTVGVDIVGSLVSSVSDLVANSAAYASLSVVLPSDPASPDDGAALSTLLNAMACAGPAADVAPCGGTSATLTSTVNVDQVIQVLTNTAYVVELYTNTSITGAIYGGAAANVDPTLTLTTTDPAYSLQFSPGLLPTPEPSTLLLAATGLASCVATARRRLGRPSSSQH